MTSLFNIYTHLCDACDRVSVHVHQTVRQHIVVYHFLKRKSIKDIRWIKKTPVISGHIIYHILNHDVFEYWILISWKECIKTV